MNAIKQLNKTIKFLKKKDYKWITGSLIVTDECLYDVEFSGDNEDLKEFLITITDYDTGDLINSFVLGKFKAFKAFLKENDIKL